MRLDELQWLPAKKPQNEFIADVPVPGTIREIRIVKWRNGKYTINPGLDYPENKIYRGLDALEAQCMIYHYLGTYGCETTTSPDTDETTKSCSSSQSKL